MNPTIALVLLALTAVAVAAFLTRRGLAGVRARRRAAWELDRAAWRLWMTRP